MTTFASLQQANPYIRQQYDEWREQRAIKGEDPTDWDAFREHLLSLGSPNPGSVPPDDFVGEDWKVANPDWVARYAGRDSQA